MSVGFSTLVAAQASPAAPVKPAQNAVVDAATEKNLDAPDIVTLGPGNRFRIGVPLRSSIAVNLGTGQLDVTLAPKIKAKQTEDDLHLVAVLGAAQASVKAGDKSVILHGVVPAFAPLRSGEYHPSDYSIRLGSGNIRNIGTPDEQFIDTEALTKKLEDLHVRLKAVAGK